MTYLELKKLAESLDFHWEIKKMCDDGSILSWFPEAYWMDNYIHSEKYHPEGNPLDHTLACLKLADDYEYDALTKIAILFHDIGKAVAAGNYKEGHLYHNFLEHEKLGVPVFECLAKRFGIPDEDAEAIKFCIRYHMRCHHFQKMRKSKVVETVLSPYWPMLKNVSYVDCASREINFRYDEIMESYEYGEKIADEYCVEENLKEICYEQF